MSKFRELVEADDGMIGFYTYVVVFSIVMGLGILFSDFIKYDAEIKLKQIQVDSIQKVLELEKIRNK